MIPQLRHSENLRVAMNISVIVCDIVEVWSSDHKTTRKVSKNKPCLDLAQEGGPDDAAAPPHEGDPAVVELPAKVGRRLSQQHEALGVRHDLGGVQGLANLVHHRSPLLSNYLKNSYFSTVQNMWVNEPLA